MHFSLSIFLGVLASTFVRSAPTATVDAATLLQNGQEAQQLNAQFQNINATSPCTTGVTACVGNAIANCVDGQFDTSAGRCSQTESCFALPNVRSAGTTLFCTSEDSALSLINATGATGGITGTNSTNSSGASSSNTENGSPTSFVVSTTAAPAASGTDIPDVVTVTLTLTPNAVTVEASTQTLSPEEASSFLSSLLAQAASTTSSPVVTASDVITSSAEAAFAAPSTTIQLTAALITESAVSSSTFAASASATPATIIQLTAAQIPQSDIASPTSTSAAAAITSAATSSSDGYAAGGSGGY